MTSLASLLRSNSPDHNAKGTQSDALSGEPPSHPPTACKRTVSGSLSLPALGCFSPVPHGTRPLSVIQESLALEGGPPSFTPGSSYRALLRNSTNHSPRHRLPGSHRLGRSIPGDFSWLHCDRLWVLQPRPHKEVGLGSADFARRYFRHLG